MNAATILDGAFRWARDRRDVTYRMGAEDPRKNGAFDCSAWVWNLLGERKHDRNTDWILRDATGPQTRFRQIEQPVPGCIAVYGSRWERQAGKVKRHAGHVGVVVDPVKKTVVDCSSSQNGIRLHRQRVLFDGPSDGRKVVFCECVGAA